VTVLTRRRLLQGAGAAGAMTTVLPGLALGAAPGENRFVLLILRGGLDGLDAVPPYADRHYVAARPKIRIPPPGAEGGAIDLNGYFGLHPALAPLHGLYRENRLLVVHAATTPYRRRSHFDGQNLLENGTAKPYGVADGWLNRALTGLGGQRLGLSVGDAVPLVMRGDAQVRTWAPSRLPEVDDDFMTRLGYVYGTDPMLAEVLRQGLESKAGAAGAMDGMNRRTGRRGRFKLLAEAAGRLLAEASGPRIAVLEAGGWDTHVNQDRRLTNLLGDLADGLEAMQTALGPAWRRTVVVTVSEFGRTVAENGTSGTDHGVGGIALILGGAVRGGRIAGAWPGLAPHQRYRERDVKPVNDYRAVFKAVLHEHMGVDQAVLEDTVFPTSRAVAPMEGIIRGA
jgi:uncharacterized protein (DUF1501 family)